MMNGAELARPLLLLVVLSVPAEAYYSPLLTTEMIGQADLIVLGKTKSVAGSYFELDVERALHGEPDKPAIKIGRLHDWACAQRFGQYLVGQRLILLLKRGAPQTAWRILGAGDEGEMLVEGERVYYRPWPDRGDRSREHAVSAGSFYGAVALLRDVVNALIDYRRLYRLLPHPQVEYWGGSVELVGTREQEANFMRRSAFHRNLVLQSKNFAEALKHR